MNNYINIETGYLEVDELDSEDHHAHEEYVITLLVSGYVTLKGESEVQIEPGTLTLVPSGFPHALLRGKEMSVYWLSFGVSNEGLGQNSALLLPFQQIRQGSLPIVKVSKERLPYITTLFKEVQRELSDTKSAIVIDSLINLIISEASNASKSKYSGLGSETRISKAMQYIELHYCDGISLKDVANAVHLSPAHLTTKMKESTGFTAGQWITKHRLKTAIERLENTDETIEQIAVKLGWADVTHFIRQFKKAYSTTPAAWRRQQAIKS